MINAFNKREARTRRHKRVRGKVFGTATRPRLCVSKSNSNIYLQLIDDEHGVTLASASTLENGIKNKKANVEAGKELAKLLVERAKQINIEEVVFDRAGYLYHGVVKAIAETAREEGLRF